MFQQLARLGLRGAAPRGVRTFTSTAPTLANPNFARMTLLGRLTATPEVRTSVNGKEFVRYTVATTDPSPPPNSNERGERERPAETTSYHNVFAFGQGVAERLGSIQKGTLVHVDAEFRVQKVPPVEEGGVPGTQYLVHHKRLQVISRPRNAPQEGEQAQEGGGSGSGGFGFGQ